MSAVITTPTTSRSTINSTVSSAAHRRRARAGWVGASVVATSAIYLVGSAAGVAFDLTDPGASKSVHLSLATIVSITLLFGLLGWGALALLERFTHRATAGWTALAAAVVALSIVPIFIEQATTGTRVALVLIHLAVGVALYPMLRTSPKPVRERR